jgi:hypothetical protein
MKNIIFACVIVSNFFFAPFCWSNDFDDGIQIDENINDQKSLELKPNSHYIKQHALMKGSNGTAIVNDGCQGTGNINVVGDNLKNVTVVNNSNNKNSTTVCAQKQITTQQPVVQQPTQQTPVQQSAPK